MQWFYDGQIKRYITQLVRLFSGFKYQDIDGKQITVPVLYGDLTRQVGAILRDNSENKVPSAPRMAIYLTRLELDRSRLSDATFVSKTHVRERAISADGTEYLNDQGRNYTVEKLMPTPYQMSINVDLWSTNTDQKLQLLEQILMLFNPSLEIQTTDNYIDWASVSTVDLEDINWSSRTIPSGTESEIDVATMGFSLPIYISPPVKVKRLGVITDIITRIHDDTNMSGSINPILGIHTGFKVDDQGNIVQTQTTHTSPYLEEDSSRNGLLGVIHTNYQNASLVIFENTARITIESNTAYQSWSQRLETMQGQLTEGVSQLRLKRADWPYEIVGLMELVDDTTMQLQWDLDTFPEDSLIPGPSSVGNKIDFIIDPHRTSPQSLTILPGMRLLILNDIGDHSNADGADAWKGTDGSDFVAHENDIIEWTGSEWVVVFDAMNSLLVYSNQPVYYLYVSNLKTSTQYKYDGKEWLLSIDGEYPPGSWRIVL